MTWRELGFREKNIKMIKCRERKKKKEKKGKWAGSFVLLILKKNPQKKSSKYSFSQKE